MNRLKKQTQELKKPNIPSPLRPLKGRNLPKSGQRSPEEEEKVSVGLFRGTSDDLESVTSHTSTGTVWEQDYSWESSVPEDLEEEDRRELKRQGRSTLNTKEPLDRQKDQEALRWLSSFNLHVRRCGIPLTEAVWILQGRLSNALASAVEHVMDREARTEAEAEAQLDKMFKGLRIACVSLRTTEAFDVYRRLRWDEGESLNHFVVKVRRAWRDCQLMGISESIPSVTMKLRNEMPLYLLRELEKSGRAPFQMEADELVEAIIAFQGNRKFHKRSYLHSVLGSSFHNNSSPGKSDELIRIPLWINGQETEAILDSGATENAISVARAEEMGLNIDVQERDVWVAGGRVAAVGTTTALVCLGSRTTEEQFLVLDSLVVGMLLGVRIARRFLTLPEDKETKEQELEELPELKRGENLETALGDLVKLMGERSEGPLGRAHVEPHRIVLREGANPRGIKNSRRINRAYEDRVKEKIFGLLDEGIIEESKAEVAYGLNIVPKGTDDVRITVDLSELNRAAAEDPYFIPDPHHLLDRVGKNKLFTVVDLTHGYFQLELDEESRPLTSFLTPWGKFQFRRVPQGLATAVAAFHRALDRILAPLSADHVGRFFDDIIIGASSTEELMKWEFKVFSILHREGFTLNPAKSLRHVSKARYLGYVIEEGSISIPEDRKEAIRNVPMPTTLKGVRSLLGMVTYYQRLIPGLQLMEKPLHELTQKDTPFMMTPRRIKAVEKIKEAVANAVVDVPTEEPGWRYHLTSDACNVGCGAVLEQRTEDGQVKTIGFFSKLFSAAERRYATVEQELLGVLLALKKFRHYLVGRRVVIWTDQKPLVNIRQRDDHPKRMSHWLWMLNNYLLEWRYIRGPENVVADFLSRMYEELELDFVGLMVDLKESIRQAQREDPMTQAIRDTLAGRPAPPEVDRRQLQRRSEKCAVDETGTVWRGEKLLVPDCMVEELLAAAHKDDEGNHLIAAAMERSLSEFHVANLQSRVTAFLKECPTCRKRYLSRRTREVSADEHRTQNWEDAQREIERQVARERELHNQEVQKLQEELEEKEEPKEFNELLRDAPFSSEQVQASDHLIDYLRKAQEENALWKQAKEALKGGGEWPAGLRRARFKLRGDLLFFKGRAGVCRLVVPEEVEREVIEWNHAQLGSGHLGTSGTMARMSHLYIPKLRSKVQAHIGRCPVCSKASWKKKDRSVEENVIPCTPFEIIAIDFIHMPTSRNGNRYILTVCDYFSGFTKAYYSPTNDAGAVVPLLIDWITTFGAPRVLMSDRGRHFIAEVVRQLLEGMRIDHRLSSPYNPTCNGRVERQNGTIKSMLRKLTQVGMDWDLALAWTNWWYNSSPSEPHGLSPYFICFGRAPRFPDDLKEVAPVEGVHEHVAILQKSFPIIRNLVMDRTRRARASRLQQPDIKFEVGDSVFYYNPSAASTRKLGVPFLGPVTVKKVLGPSTYELDLPKNHRQGNVFNVNALRTYDPNIPVSEEQKEWMERELQQSIEGPEEKSKDENPMVSGREGTEEKKNANDIVRPPSRIQPSRAAKARSQFG